MSNDTAIMRLFKLQAKINMMVVDGNRDATVVADALQQILEEKRHCLTAPTLVTVPAFAINPHDFFKSRNGLWVSTEFKDLILSGAANQQVSADEAAISYVDVLQDVNDTEISDQLPEGYVFENVDMFLVLLATLIEGQWDGKRGALIKSININTFHVKVNNEILVIIVSWSNDLNEWYCDARRLVEGQWIAGRRIFAATAVAA